MSRLRFVDLATLAYLAAVAVLLGVARDRASAHWPALLAGHVGLAAAVAAIVRLPDSGAAGWIRELYPLPLFILLYRESELLNRTVFARPLDPWFLRQEQAWFGTRPSLAFAQWLPATWAAEVLYAAYFSFYVMILGMGAWLVARDRAAARRFIGVLSAVFYTCYALFIVLPVVGPRVLDTGGLDAATVSSLGLDAVPPLPATTQAGPFARLMAVLYAVFEGEGGAFPSSHVIVACLTLRESFAHRLRIRWLHAVAVALLCLGTVYGRYHYLVDVLAGLVLAPVLAGAAEWLRRRVEDGRPDAVQSARS